MTELICGALGTVRGVELLAVVATPAPALFTKRNIGVYAVPFNNPTMVKGEVEEGIRIQVFPLSNEYSAAVIELPLSATVYANVN